MGDVDVRHTTGLDVATGPTVTADGSARGGFAPAGRTALRDGGTLKVLYDDVEVASVRAAAQLAG